MLSGLILPDVRSPGVLAHCRSSRPLLADAKNLQEKKNTHDQKN